MNLLHRTTPRFPATSSLLRHRNFSPSLLIRRRFTVRSSLPFPQQNAEYYRELQAAVDVVESACRLCVDVKKSLSSSDGRIAEKSDQTPVTIADFGIQALISLELGKLFPSIPLVAEEDSAVLSSTKLVDSVVNVVSDRASSKDEPLTKADVLEAIDRGGKIGPEQATYWRLHESFTKPPSWRKDEDCVLDPIDGTRGFVKGTEALYVVGLALVVEGNIVLGVMGCPNWPEEESIKSITEVKEYKKAPLAPGIIMVAHVGCGTWSKGLSDIEGSTAKLPMSWTRSYVDGCSLAHKGRFCIPESQTWESMPLSPLFDLTTSMDNIGNNQVLVLSICCGSLCKYLMVASGRASVFIQRARAERIIKVWDHVVGVICVHEAGGKVTDWRGDELDLTADQVERRALFPQGGILVTNSSLHDQIVEMIASPSPVA